MFNWFKKLFGKEEQKQVQVVDSGSVAVQYGGDITISTPGSIHLSAKTIEAPVVSEADRVLAAIKARKPVQSTQTVRRNPAPHASAPISPSRSRGASARRRDDYIDNSPSLVDYAIIHAATSPSYDSSPSYSSSSSSYDSCSSSSSSSYDSGSSSSDSGSCGGGD
jgi:hypothetical protein